MAQSSCFLNRKICDFTAFHIISMSEEFARLFCNNGRAWRRCHIAHYSFALLPLVDKRSRTTDFKYSFQIYIEAPAVVISFFCFRLKHVGYIQAFIKVNNHLKKKRKNKQIVQIKKNRTKTWRNEIDSVKFFIRKVYLHNLYFPKLWKHLGLYQISPTSNS